MKPIAQLAPGEMATVIAEVRAVKMSGFKRRSLGMFEARFTDASRAILVGKWFHGGYLANVLAEGMKVALFGKVEFDSYAGELTMLHPEFEILSGDEDEGEATLHVGRVVPIYEGTGKLTTKILRTLMHRILENIDPVDDALPEFLRARLKMPDRWTALREIHFPQPETDLRLLNAFRSPAQFRLIYEEFFWLECGVALKRSKARAVPGIGFELNDRVRERVKAMLPFKPTGAQKRVLKEIADDMAAPASDEPPAAGRRGQRQDDRGRRGRGDRHRERLPGGGAGADGNPGHAAQLHLQTDSRQAGLCHRAVDRKLHRAGEGATQEAAVRGSGARGYRHARAHPERCRVQEPGPRHHRRAASFRRAAAPGPGAKRRHAGRPGDDRHAHPAHARHDDVRRPGRQRDRRDAAGPQAHRHQTFDRRPHRKGLQLHEGADRRRAAGVRGVPRDRGVRGAGDEGGAEGVRAPLARGLPGYCRGPDARPPGRRREGKP